MADRSRGGGFSSDIARVFRFQCGVGYFHVDYILAFQGVALGSLLSKQSIFLASLFCSR
jgi:hypothetical protein